MSANVFQLDGVPSRRIIIKFSRNVILTNASSQGQVESIDCCHIMFNPLGGNQKNWERFKKKKWCKKCFFLLLLWRVEEICFRYCCWAKKKNVSVSAKKKCFPDWDKPILSLSLSSLNSYHQVYYECQVAKHVLVAAESQPNQTKPNRSQTEFTSLFWCRGLFFVPLLSFSFVFFLVLTLCFTVPLHQLPPKLDKGPKFVIVTNPSYY